MPTNEEKRGNPLESEESDWIQLAPKHYMLCTQYSLLTNPSSSA